MESKKAQKFFSSHKCQYKGCEEVAVGILFGVLYCQKHYKESKRKWHRSKKKALAPAIVVYE